MIDDARKTEQWPSVAAEADRQLLRDRARELARPLDAPDVEAELRDVLMFGLCGERYGVEARYVSEAGLLGEPTRLPGAPAFIHGIVNHRGRIIPVLDLRVLLELPLRHDVDGLHVITVEAAGMAFGMLVETIDGVAPVAPQSLSRPSASGPHSAWVLGATSDMAVVLDVVALARDPRIVVNDVASDSTPHRATQPEA